METILTSRLLDGLTKKMKNMKKKTTISLLLLLIAICMYGQKSGPIYEIGDSIANCETNFENLVNNWTNDNVTNAYEYKLFRYAFVETITDSVRYKYYRNYFSGDKMLSCSTSGNSGETNGRKYHTFYIRPEYATHREFNDTSNMTEKQKTILSDDFRQKARELSTRDLDVDKMTLKHYRYEYHKADTVWQEADHKSISSISNRSNSHDIAYPDSISANYIDFRVFGKNFYDQSDDITEIRRLILEDLLVSRIQLQLSFNQAVQLSDKVYAVRFEYLGKLYTNYVICSAKTNKVVLDYFFKGINAEQPKLLVRASKGI